MEETARGLTVYFKGRKYDLVFPKNTWGLLPDELKAFFTQEFSFISTAPMPLVSDINHVTYNTPQPLFEDDVKEIILRQIPGIADDYNLDTQDTLDRFQNIDYSFTGDSIFDVEANADDGAILLLSCGKDSLLTLGLARELELETTPLLVNDTTTPHENSVSLETIQKIEKKFDIKAEVVTNNIEKLNDYETWNKPPSCLGYSHMITSFCFLAVPFLHNNASMVLLGNQQNMNFSFKTKEDFTGYPSYDQTTEARHKQQQTLMYLNKDFRIFSLVEPLTDIAEIKVLFSRYPELAKYEFSCTCLYGTNEKRWCHSCNKCARLSLFMHAHNIDPKKVGLRNMLSRPFMKFYRLFGLNPEVDRYEKSIQARDQQLLAFYMAYKNGVEGQLIDLFKEKFLSEAVAREDELYKQFFRIYTTDVHSAFEKKLYSIFKEELADVE